MAPRAYWKGWLKVAAISCPVRLHGATTEANRITFHEINRATGHRITLRPHDPETGEEVPKAQLVKGYEIESGRFLLVEPEEVDELRASATRTIEIEEFVPVSELDPFYLEKPYYLAPDGAVAADGYGVLREAMARTGTAGIGRVVLSRLERAVALTPRGPGMVMTTLRPPIDLRAEAEFFSGIGEGQLDPEMVDLAGLIMDRRAGHFDPAAFEDRWQTALRRLVEAKLEGKTPAPPKLRRPARVTDLKDALRRAVAAEGGARRRHAG